MIGLFVAVAVLSLLELLVWRYGADSRDGHDWQMPRPSRQSPLA
jgi:hypothetical protein